MRKFVGLCALALMLSACGQHGSRQADLKPTLEHGHVAETSAWRSFERGDSTSAIDAWARLADQTERERADDMDYYTNMRYLDAARYWSSIGWAHLTDGRFEASREAYNTAFSKLYGGEAGHRNTVEMDRQAATREAAFVQAWGDYLAQSAENPGVRIGAAMLTSYMHEHGLAPKFLETDQAPVLFEGLDRLSSDGIRINVLPDAPPLTNIGRLSNGGSWCTASLVGERIALTNAHCVTEGDLETELWRFAGANGFEVTFESVEVPDRVRVTEVVLSHKNMIQGGWRLRDWQHDWALLVLDRHPVRRGYFGLIDRSARLSEGSRVFLAGYSGDQSDGRFLSVHWGCVVTELTDGVAEDNCRSWGGSSGSPMLFTDGDFRRFYVFGLHAFGRGERFDRLGYKVASEGGGGPRAGQFLDAYADLRARLDEKTLVSWRWR